MSRFGAAPPRWRGASETVPDEVPADSIAAADEAAVAGDVRRHPRRGYVAHLSHGLTPQGVIATLSGWDSQQVVVAHGACVHGREVLERALRWLRSQR